jgi:type IV pilus assembly protein PilO
MILGVLDEFVNRPRGQRIGIFAGILLLVGFLDWTFWYGPKADSLTLERELLTQRRAELEDKRTKTDARAEAERELRELQAELRRAEARLPDEREIADLLSNIAASGRAVGLDITLFRQKPEQFSDFYAQVPVQMEMRGSYHEVAQFLDRVRQLDRIVNIGDIKLKKPRVQQGQVVIDSACTATTFRFLQEAERKLREEQAKKQDKKKS